MITIFAQRSVSDYDAWKKGFDALPKEHYEKYKIVGTKTFRMMDGKAIIVMHTFNTLEDAMKHKELMESMTQLIYWIAEEV